jgi:outer membrane protein OmpA-like peptidoglycan-associated protein
MTKNGFKMKWIALTLIAIMVLNGCKNSNASKGAALGAASGGIIGAVIGSKKGNTAKGAIIGAAIGGAAGIAIGHYMDRQAAELQKDLKGAEVERVGEGIKITFHKGIEFATNSAELRPASKTNLKELAEVLQKYEDTEILIEGHTDSTGERDYNQTLSEKRAESVSAYLKSLKVASSRLTNVGYGPDQPVADNTTVDGRQKNRRVEVAIMANEKLKRKAEKGEI